MKKRGQTTEAIKARTRAARLPDGTFMTPERALDLLHAAYSLPIAWRSGVLMEPWHKEDPGIEAPGVVIVRRVSR